MVYNIIAVEATQYAQELFVMPENKSKKWIVGHPGGPSGPFWSVVAQNGNVIALQITEEKYACLIASLGEILACDFNIVHEAGNRLQNIMARDFPDLDKDKFPVRRGGNDYAIRAAIEALFKEQS